MLISDQDCDSSTLLSELPPNSQLVLTGDNGPPAQSLDQYATVQCDPGFERNGTGAFVCIATGYSGSFAGITCEPIREHLLHRSMRKPEARLRP